MPLQRSSDTISEVMAFLRAELTEDRTDEWLEILLSKLKLPWWIPGAIVKRVLDALVPEQLLDSLEDLLRRAVQ